MKKRLKLIWPLFFTSILATSLVLSSCKVSHAVSEDVFFKRSIDEFTNRHFTLTNEGKNITVNQLSKDNIAQYIVDWPETLNNLIKVQIINIQSLSNQLGSVKLIVEFSYANFVEQKECIVSGFAIDALDLSPAENLKEIVQNFIQQFDQNPPKINDEGKKITNTQVDLNNVEKYLEQFITSDKVKTNISNLQYIDYDSVKLTINFSYKTYQENKDYVISGFKVNPMDLIPSIPNHQAIIQNALNDLTDHPIEINDLGKQTEIKNVEQNNVRNYLNNLPINKTHLQVSIIDFKKVPYDTIEFKIRFQSGDIIQESATQIISGFKVSLSSLTPSKYKPTPITKPASPTDRIVGQKGREDQIKNKVYELNGLKNTADRILEDAKNNATKKINIFYNLSYLAVLHKYGTIAHLLKLTESLNTYQNLNIYLNINDQHPNDKNGYLHKDKFNFENFTKKYPQVKISWASDKATSLKTIDNFLLNTLDYIEENNLNNYKTNNNYLFIDDMSYVEPFRSSLMSPSSFEFNRLLPLLNFKEINIIPDGSSTAAQFDDNVYSFWKNNDYLQYDATTQSFIHAKTLMEELASNYHTNNSDYINDWLTKDKNNSLTAFAAMLSAPIMNNSGIKQYPNTRFFQASVNLVKDVNNQTSTILSNNDSDDVYFDPYNTESLNIIDFFAELNSDSRTLFAEITKFNSTSSYEQAFENKLNYVYGGGYMSVGVEEESVQEYFLRHEAQRVIQIYDDLVATTSNKTFKIWFKAHPREKNNYQDKLKEAIKKELMNETSKGEQVTQALDFLDEQIPMEYYVMTGLFTPDTSKNKEVKCATGYSTFALSVLDSKTNKDIVDKIYILENQSDILLRFGVKNGANQSLCFPENKVVYYKENKSIL